MTATGSHFDFDSLRGAPLARNDMVLFGHFAILRQLPLHKGAGGAPAPVRFSAAPGYFRQLEHGVYPASMAA